MREDKGKGKAERCEKKRGSEAETPRTSPPMFDQHLSANTGTHLHPCILSGFADDGSRFGGSVVQMGQARASWSLYH